MKSKVSNLLIQKAIEIACATNKLSLDEIHIKSRKRHIVEARQMAHWLLYKPVADVFGNNKNQYNISLYNIGLSIGNKTHATVINSINAINSLMDIYPDFRDKMIKAREEMDVLYSGTTINTDNPLCVLDINSLFKNLYIYTSELDAKQVTNKDEISSVLIEELKNNNTKIISVGGASFFIKFRFD